MAPVDQDAAFVRLRGMVGEDELTQTVHVGPSTHSCADFIADYWREIRSFWRGLIADFPGEPRQNGGQPRQNWL